MKLYQLLVESRIDFLKDKYIPLLVDKMINGYLKLNNYNLKDLGEEFIEGLTDSMTFDATTDFEYVIKYVDPTNNKIYTQWFLNQALLIDDHRLFNRLMEEDLDKYKEYLTIYHKAKSKLPLQQRDINKLSLNDLKDIALQYKEKQDEIGTKSEVLDKRYKIAENESFVAYMFNSSTQEDFKMYQLVSTNTEWCTRPGYGYFSDYINQSPLFVFINKNNRIEKYQWHFDSLQFMDREDRDEWFEKSFVIDENEKNQLVFPKAMKETSLFQFLFNMIKHYVKPKFNFNEFFIYGGLTNEKLIYNPKTDKLLFIQDISSIEPITDDAIFISSKMFLNPSEGVVLDENFNTVFGPAEATDLIDDKYIYFSIIKQRENFLFNIQTGQLYIVYNDNPYDKNNIRKIEKRMYPYLNTIIMEPFKSMA